MHYRLFTRPWFSSGQLTVDASTISGNVIGEPISGDPGANDTQGYGGGIYNTGSEVWIRRSTVIENVAGALGEGGGIYNGGKMVIGDSTVGGNVAPTQGSGIFNFGTLDLQGVTIAGNWVQGIIREGVDEPSSPPDCTLDTPQFCISSGGGTWTDPAGITRIATSLIAENFPPDVVGATPDDLINVNPQIGALQDDGVPGNAHYPLLADSPLIDAGGEVGNHCTPRDQIGNPRVDARRHEREILCDIGAIEFQPPRYR